MTKPELIDAIRRLNRSVSAEYLLEFTDAMLREYLQRLTLLHGRRGRATVWVRHTTARAIATRPTV